MEFDKSRVYTAVNADEVPIGSKCIFADDLNMLRKKVQEAENYVLELTGIAEDCEMFRFKNFDDEYALVYLVELPKEPEYKPFSSTEKAMEVIKKHGGWVKEKISGDLKLISCIGKISDSMLSICVGSTYFTSTTLLKDFIFADDGSPCGELAVDWRKN